MFLLPLLPLLLAVTWPRGSLASEYPERECCDPIYPLLGPTNRMMPTVPTTTGKSGSEKTVAILNCLYARKLCFEDHSCSAILEVIPRVCGIEQMACSTVTVAKCQAALRSLQTFEFFKPTCLCREPHVDRECNRFRDFLFDHPCIFVAKKDKESHGLQEALPTCNKALSVCQLNKSCVKLYDEFKVNCKTREGKCRMENRDACDEAWKQLRLSPMFGCICPDNAVKKRCDRIFSMVNYNPCVEWQVAWLDELAGTDSGLYLGRPDQQQQQQQQQRPRQQSADPEATRAYPYFLFPASAREQAGPGLSSAYYELDPEVARSLEEHELAGGQPPVGRPKIFLLEPDSAAARGSASRPLRVFENERWHTQWVHLAPYRPPSPSSGTAPARAPASTPVSHRHRHQHQTHQHQHQHQHQHRPGTGTATSTSTSAAAPAPGGAPAESPPPRRFAPRPTYEHGAAGFEPGADDEQRRLEAAGELGPASPERLPIERLFDSSSLHAGRAPVNVISGVGDNATNLELIESQLENPLIDSEQQDLHSLRQLPIPSIHHHRLHHGPRNQSQHEPEPEHEQHPGGASGSGQPEPRLVLSSTCQHAYAACKSDAECKGLMQPVLSHCEQSSCARNECMSALQHFYRGASHKHSVEIAFCLCRKEEGRRNECMLAQERMHPVCAMRAAPPAETPSCSLLAEECRARAACRTRLEHYEQSCAVDSVTSKCAGQPQNCRAALLGILGTELRTSCTCRAHDAQGLYRCLGWQRLLWLNPCLVEAQREFHARRSRQHLQQRITTSSSTPATRLTPTPRAPLMAPTADDLEQEDKQLLENNAVGYATIEATEPTLQPSSSEGSPPTGTGAGASRGPLPTTATPTANTVATTTRPRTTAASGSSSSTTTTTAAAATTTTTTTTVTTSTTARPAPPTTPSSTTTSTPPPRFCVVQRPRQSHQYIREGKTRRLYREDEPECSELCKCGRNETLTCNTICIESSPCKTDFAFYNHAAPAYQAYRGRCLCYSGRFICMRPSPDAYNIPHGVFMFLGYSETDETLLKPHNNLSVVDAVSSLDSFMREELNNQTVCTLFLYNATRENVIAAARLLTDAGQLAANLSQAQSLQHLLRIKEECAAMLQELSEKINNRHQEVHSHPLLSIFKMAEVEIKLPRASGSAARTPLLPPALLLLLLLLLALASS
ncbi:uncharacterized protein LOC131666463 isoform X1 [Phymastichus coffea]|uniref:uncharacterized protein LOC131666463 isoform X1 n=1 Tax=Phymastichus coffea TaxID=108790 RepID=UPI00273B288C|nr:uncharacterized protein LOC131666463 isoform X1 [Phymastichus coffea]